MKELFIRYGIFYFILGGINYILSSSSILNLKEPLVLIVIVLFQLVINGLFIVHVLLHVFSRDKLLFYEHISQTRNAIILKKLTNNTLSAFFIIVNNFLCKDLKTFLLHLITSSPLETNATLDIYFVIFRTLTYAFSPMRASSYFRKIFSTSPK